MSEEKKEMFEEEIEEQTTEITDDEEFEEEEIEENESQDQSSQAKKDFFSNLLGNKKMLGMIFGGIISLSILSGVLVAFLEGEEEPSGPPVMISSNPVSKAVPVQPSLKPALPQKKDNSGSGQLPVQISGQATKVLPPKQSKDVANPIVHKVPVSQTFASKPQNVQMPQVTSTSSVSEAEVLLKQNPFLSDYLKNVLDNAVERIVAEKVQEIKRKQQQNTSHTRTRPTIGISNDSQKDKQKKEKKTFSVPSAVIVNGIIQDSQTKEVTLRLNDGTLLFKGASFKGGKIVSVNERSFIVKSPEGKRFTVRAILILPQAEPVSVSTKSMTTASNITTENPDVTVTLGPSAQ